ncbi:alpha/beta hydrolase [Nonomuraea sp. PA05]|uniref:alpha/beta hydrolase n=1 Tax=Nonomuraea sp. PA05 TaxID=2604466 RepID=UPI001651EC28|nr:alpha/beta hydrolase [Nonomuraea sp. PA05]
MSFHELLTRTVRDPDRVIRFGPHPDQVIDVHLPPRETAPAVVLLHGGFWLSRYDRTHARPMAAALAALGHRVYVPEYRRLGQEGGGYPGTFDDVAAAVDLVARERRGIVVAGHSAGGHLALWSALRHRLPASCPWRGEPAIDAVVGLAALSDLGEAYTSGLGDGAAVRLVDGRPELLARTDPARLLPPAPAPGPALAALPASAVRLALVHGARDRLVPVDMSRRFAIRAGAELTEIEDAGHFALLDPLSTAWPAVIRAMAQARPPADGRKRSPACTLLAARDPLPAF